MDGNRRDLLASGPGIFFFFLLPFLIVKVNPSCTNPNRLIAVFSSFGFGVGLFGDPFDLLMVHEFYLRSLIVACHRHT